MITIVQIKRTSDACPAQWDGVTGDYCKLYVRYRHGYLSIRIGPQYDMSKDAAVDGKEIFGLECGDSGGISYDTLKALTKGKFIWPERE